MLSGLEIHGMHRSVFFEKRIEGILAGLLVRSLHPSLYPRTPLIWFEQQNLFFNLRLAMIWHVFLFNFLQWLQNTQEACLCHSRPGWYETIGTSYEILRSQLWNFEVSPAKPIWRSFCFTKILITFLRSLEALYHTKFEQYHAKPHLSTSILVYLMSANSFCGLQTEVAVLGRCDKVFWQEFLFY